MHWVRIMSVEAMRLIGFSPRIGVTPPIDYCGFMSDLNNPDLILALAYAPRTRHAHHHALWMLDEALGQIIATTREPMLAEIKLAWWRDQLEGDRRAASPLLSAIEQSLSTLTPLIDGWRALLEPFPLSRSGLTTYAEGRGGTLFASMGSDRARIIGAGWALTDFAYRCSDPETQALSAEMARSCFEEAGKERQETPAAILAHLAKADLADGFPRRHALGSPRRIVRAARAALFNRPLFHR
jgi:15-cis-phytoene synthase